MLREGGWCQGDSEDAKGRHCATGAIDKVSVMCGRNASDIATKALVVGAAKVTPRSVETSNIWPGSAIVEWNDHRTRRAGQVIAAFKHAIKALERGQVQA